MREIKFRAWHREKKCWLDSVRIYGDGSWSGSVVEERGEVDGYDERECELMQFTGLKDKNGKEIYEGDIVQFATGTCRQVIYQPPSFILKKRKTDKTWTEFVLAYTENQLETVIGNIYEHPELLKEK